MRQRTALVSAGGREAVPCSCWSLARTTSSQASKASSHDDEANGDGKCRLCRSLAEPPVLASQSPESPVVRQRSTNLVAAKDRLWPLSVLRSTDTSRPVAVLQEILHDSDQTEQEHCYQRVMVRAECHVGLRPLRADSIPGPGLRQGHRLPSTRFTSKAASVPAAARTASRPASRPPRRER